MENELGKILPTVFGGQPGHAGWGSASGRSSRGPRRRPPLDQVELTEPRRVVLRLLRERVLENTRLLLDLPVRMRRRTFADLTEPPGEHADRFVGRLLSDQNWLAARRAGTWPAARIREATADGMTDGVSETLHILYEVGELDAEAWTLVCDVLAEFQRKVEASAGP